jgi:hypothetical protein
LVNKVSKLYVRKPKMSEEIGGLYVGLALRRMILEHLACEIDAPT